MTIKRSKWQRVTVFFLLVGISLSSISMAVYQRKTPSDRFSERYPGYSSLMGVPYYVTDPPKSRWDYGIYMSH